MNLHEYQAKQLFAEYGLAGVQRVSQSRHCGRRGTAAAEEDRRRANG